MKLFLGGLLGLKKAVPTSIESEFIGISLSLFKRFKLPLFFDVFVQRAEGKYTKLFNHGDMIDWTRAQSYAKKGVQSFFVTKNDYDKYNIYVQKISSKYLGKNSSVPSMERMNILKELVIVTMYDIVYKTKLDETTIRSAGTAVESCIANIQENPKSLVKIIHMINNHPHSMRHALSCSIFAILLARADRIDSRMNLHIIGLGAFLHDVGMGYLSFDAEDQDHLTPDHWKEIKTHPEVGKRQLDMIKGVRPEVLTIVMQHHEQPNGRGYPNALTTGQIFHPAKIVAIADGFSALLSERPFREAKTPSEAIQIMQSDVGKYDSQLLNLLCKVLKIR